MSVVIFSVVWEENNALAQREVKKMGGSDERCLWHLQAVWTAELTGDFRNTDTKL